MEKIFLEQDVKAPAGICTTTDRYCHRIWENDKWYLYVTPIMSYELFKRNIFRPYKELDKVTKLPVISKTYVKEAYPKDEDFGDFAWAFNNLDSVFRFLNIERPTNIVLPF